MEPPAVARQPLNSDHRGRPRPGSVFCHQETYMSFVNTQPAAIAAAAAQLEGIGNSFAAESAGRGELDHGRRFLPPPTRCRSCRQGCSRPTVSSTSRSAPRLRRFTSSSPAAEPELRLLPGDRDGQPGRRRGELAVQRGVGRLVGRRSAGRRDHQPHRLHQRFDQRADRLGPEQQHRQPRQHQHR